jgi:carboxylesterase type B
LAGKTVENEGVPNAGFWDQRAVLEWIQKYIHLVGGDKTKVTAMGISAGAGSIQHHLIAEGGTLDPLFSKAILQSPGYMNLQDRHGQIEANYKKFESFAGCEGKGLACLRELNPTSLKIASDKAQALAQPGSFTFGPTPDGKYIVNTPTLEFTAGRFWKGLDKVINSHVTDEGSMFVDHTFVTDATFDNMLDAQFGNNSLVTQLRVRAKRMYPPINYLDSPYKYEQDRLANFISESTFTCHNRLISDAYAGKVYGTEYAVAPATHGSDQSATFFSPYGAAFRGIPPEAIGERMAYQSYFLSFIRTGDPNTYRNNETIAWPLTTGFNETLLHNTLKFTYPIGPDGSAIVENELEDKSRCDFWAEVQRTVGKVLEASTI